MQVLSIEKKKLIKLKFNIKFSKDNNMNQDTISFYPTILSIAECKSKYVNRFLICEKLSI